MVAWCWSEAQGAAKGEEDGSLFAAATFTAVAF